MCGGTGPEGGGTPASPSDGPSHSVSGTATDTVTDTDPLLVRRGGPSENTSRAPAPDSIIPRQPRPALSSASRPAAAQASGPYTMTGQVSGPCTMAAVGYQYGAPLPPAARHHRAARATHTGSITRTQRRREYRRYSRRRYGSPTAQLELAAADRASAGPG